MDIGLLGLEAGYRWVRPGEPAELVAAHGALESAAGRAGHRPRTLVPAGPPARVVAAYARRKDVDVVVLGGHQSRPTTALLGGVRPRDPRDARTPVVVPDAPGTRDRAGVGAVVSACLPA